MNLKTLAENVEKYSVVHYIFGRELKVGTDDI